MTLGGDWARLEAALPADWLRAEYLLRVGDPAASDRAAALLGPLNPFRQGDDELVFSVVRAGGLGTDGARRLLGGLDGEEIAGSLEVRAVLTSGGETTDGGGGLAAAWDAMVATLPEDWSDLHCELALDYGDELDRAALLVAPINPVRHKPEPALRFRVARTFGYGCSPGMARRCLARLDEQRIPGSVKVLRMLCDTRPAATQGPVWYAGGKVI